MLNLTAAELIILRDAMNAHTDATWNAMTGPVTDEWHEIANLRDKVRAALANLPVPTNIEG
jgi:hypothetical protein